MSEPRPPEPDPARPDRKNERAFAIQSPQHEIWRLLLDEVHLGVDSGRAEIVRQEPPRTLVVDIRLGRGLSVRYDYQLTPLRPDVGQPNLPHTEVAVTVVPYGMRHALANIITFGRGLTPHMLAVTQGLANLKAAAEPTPLDTPPPGVR
ncbi:MAG: hypothetical protein DK306_001713 [Chloroflexi bacterium]|nr:MAG: hypothetical protein DK306_001713 [Chloroflexota bacterium]